MSLLSKSIKNIKGDSKKCSENLYSSFISPQLLHIILSQSSTVVGVPRLRIANIDFDKDAIALERDALALITLLYEKCRSRLKEVLVQRQKDRDWIDEETKLLSQNNILLNRKPSDDDFESVVGVMDSHDRVVVGPVHGSDYRNGNGKNVAEIPEYLKGYHITLFGPAENPRMCVNALNAAHRVIPGEPEIVKNLVEGSNIVPKWGADDEDSKTPMRSCFLKSMVNLDGCFKKSIQVEGLKLENERLSQPIKRIPGLGIPSTWLVYDEVELIPLHIYDFALHLFNLWNVPEALTFYIPKLENEEEAKYVHFMVEQAELMIKDIHHEYVLGTVKIMVIVENPRAIFRINEIMDALHPYFVGASLGWHDYVAATARLFKEDPSYNMPSKSDPQIVIKHIKESHLLLSRVVKSRGGIALGGMYGVLPFEKNIDSPSMQVTLMGLVRDIVAQLKRGLDGFWLAHPDFIRVGIAIVEAYKNNSLEALISSLITNEENRKKVIDFIQNGEDQVPSLDPNDHLYPRALLAAELSASSSHIQNNDPEEIRYNIYQSLQYLVDWLQGNGCVALPAIINGIPVRVMDDLATTERSRWEVWHEVKHGRVSVFDVLCIIHEELSYIIKGVPKDKHIHVPYNSDTAKWYRVAHYILLKLMCDDEPVEFVTELLLPFTLPQIRNEQDPWKAVLTLEPSKYAMVHSVVILDTLLEACFCKRVVLDKYHNKDFTNLNEEELGLACSFLPEELISQQKDLNLFFQNRLEESIRAVMGFDDIEKQISKALKDSGVHGVSVGLLTPNDEDVSVWGIASGIATHDQKPMTSNTWLQIASLSKPIATAFAIDYFARMGHSIETPVNKLLTLSGSPFRLTSDEDPSWAEEVLLKNLVSHSALGQHYVFGIPETDNVTLLQILNGYTTPTGSYAPLKVSKRPNTKFGYSGGGFVVLQHIIESFENRPIDQVMKPWLEGLGIDDLVMPPIENHSHFIPPNTVYGDGFLPDGKVVDRYSFPALAAGGIGTAKAVAKFLKHLIIAYHRLEGSGTMSHDAAVLMVGQPIREIELGARAFMDSSVGIGIFFCDCGENRIALHQAANEGFRGIFVACYDGPDRGKGFVVLSNGDNNALSLNVEVCHILLKYFNFQGFDFKNLPDFDTFRAEGISQENLVNLCYKKLLFGGFTHDLPNRYPPGTHHALVKYDLLNEATVVSVTDERFAQAINLVDPSEPQFDPALFNRAGKAMDSWETQRHNPADADIAEFELKKPGNVRYIEVSTKWHNGNHAVFTQIDALSRGEWKIILEKTPLYGHTVHRYVVEEVFVERIRVYNYPDGGISRVRMYDNIPTEMESEFPSIVPCPDSIPSVIKATALTSKSYDLPTDEEVQRNWKRVVKGSEIDIACSYFGGKVIECSNQHYGPSVAVIQPYRPRGMFDGFETSRSRKPGHFEYLIIQLGKKAKLSRIVLNMRYFVYNNPNRVTIEAFDGNNWNRIAYNLYTKPYRGNKLELKIGEKDQTEYEKIMVSVHPCGGINRIHAYTIIDN